MRTTGVVFHFLVAVVALIPFASLAQDVTSVTLERLRSEAEQIRREASEIGGSDSIFDALNKLRQRQFDLEEQQDRMKDLVVAVGGQLEDLEAYMLTEEARRIRERYDPVDEAKDNVRERFIEEVLVRIFGEVVRDLMGPASTAGDVLVSLELKRIKESNLAEFRRLVAEEKIRLRDMYVLQMMIEVERTHTATKVRQVEAMKAEYDLKMAEIADEHARLIRENDKTALPPVGPSATDYAKLMRDADSLDDLFQQVTALTGLPVEAWGWHMGARSLGTEKIAYCAPFSGVAGPVVYGTDVYDLSSTLCFAAVHAGMFTVESGGFARIIMVESDGAEGSTRNGVTSDGFGRGRQAFRFQRG